MSRQCPLQSSCALSFLLQTEYNPMIPYLHVGLIHVTSSSDEEDGEIAGGSRCAAVALPITRPSMNAQKVLQRERQEETPIVANRKVYNFFFIFLLSFCLICSFFKHFRFNIRNGCLSYLKSFADGKA